MRNSESINTVEWIINERNMCRWLITVRLRAEENDKIQRAEYGNRKASAKYELCRNGEEASSITNKRIFAFFLFVYRST
jgi:hypothetical protein